MPSQDQHAAHPNPASGLLPGAAARKTAGSTKILLMGAALSCAAAVWGAGRFGRAGTVTAPRRGFSESCATTQAAPSASNSAFALGRLSGALSAGQILAGGDGEVFVSVDLETRDGVNAAARAPVDIALVIDRSGSMSGDKIENAKQAARGLVERLGNDDRVSVVQYDDSAQVLVPLVRLDAAGRARITAALAEMFPGGGTNLGAGLQLGRDELARGFGLHRANRIILMSDGQANEGITDPAALSEIARAAADKGARLSTVGVGLDYNEDLMEALAEHGRGRYHYVKEAGDLQAVFSAELSSLKATVATATELRLVPSCAGVEVVEVFGYEMRRLPGVEHAVAVPMTDLFAGDKRRVMARLRVPAGQVGAVDVVRVSLAYTDVAAKAAGQAEIELGAAVARDSVAVAASANRDIITAVLEVDSANTMRKAARAYEQGDREQARKLLEATEAKVSSAQARFNLAPTQAADALLGVASMKGEIDAYEPGSAGGKNALKMGKQMAQYKMKQRASEVKKFMK